MSANVSDTAGAEVPHATATEARAAALALIVPPVVRLIRGKKKPPATV